eukprot:5977138-Pleurochrysis_carterae.AAC.1
MATPGGVPAASASATCSRPGELKAASSARSTSLASHAAASRGRSPSNASCFGPWSPPSHESSPAAAARRLSPTLGGASSGAGVSKSRRVRASRSSETRRSNSDSGDSAAGAPAPLDSP